MAERRQKVTDEGSLHKYRAEIPNTVVRGIKSRGLSVYAKWLYVYLKSIAGDGGLCFQSTTTIAGESGMSRGQVSEAKKELVKQGLIAVAQGKNPRRDTDHIRIKDIWLANIQEFSVHNTNTLNTDEEVDLPSASAVSVHNTNTESAQCSQYEQSVHNTNTSVHNTNQRRSLEEDPLKKETNTPLSPQGGKRKKVKPVGQVMPESSEAQETMRMTIFDSNFSNWLSRRHPHVDAEEQWEFFANQCRSKGYEYLDFRAAFMNSFTWENSPAHRKRTNNIDPYDPKNWNLEELGTP